MINQQLVDYIKQQLQAGVSKDAVRKALADAGWPLADIDDSLKAAEPAMPAAGPVAAPAAAQTINPVVAMGGAEMDDAASALERTKSASSNKFFSAQSGQPAASTVMAAEDDVHPSVKKFVIAMGVMGVVILLLAGALAFVYFSMSGQPAPVAGTPDNSAQVGTLQGQVSQLTKANEDLTAQVNALSTANGDLMAEVSFFAAPAANATSSSASIKGLLAGNGTLPFVLTTAHNLKIYVANYKDPKVLAALTPLANTTTTVQLTGTHAAASPNLTVTAVNGAAL